MKDEEDVCVTHHPNVTRDEKGFGVGGEERHSLPRMPLLVILRVQP